MASNKQLILCCLFLWLAQNLTATNYFVSNAGSNMNDGTSTNPFATIQHAADLMTAGDTTFIMPGTYTGFDFRSANGTASQPIVFMAQGANVTINNNGPLREDGINIENVDYVILDGFQVIGMVNGGNGIRLVNADHCVVRNCYCDQNDERGIFTGFTDDILIEYNVCTNSIDEHGIYVSNSSDRPIIRYNECYGNNNIGIHMNGDLSAGGDGIISGAQVYGNIIHDNNLAAGINMDGCEDPLVYNNLIYNNHSAQGIALFQIDGAIPTRGASIYNNTIIVPSDGRWGILVKDGSNIGTKIFNNIIINDHSFRGCITVEDTTGFRSDYNLVMDKMSDAGDGVVISFEDWQTLGFGLNSQLLGNIADVFVDAPNDNYQLKIGGQAINSGTDAVNSLVIDDIEKNVRPQGGFFDLGCYEFLEATSPVDLALLQQSIELFPNPTVGLFQIGGLTTAYDIKILNGSGQVYQSLNSSSGLIQIDLSDLPNGLYFISILSIASNALSFQKIIKM